MRILHLTLKKKWFDMILSGEKKEEYRDFTERYKKMFANWKYEYTHIEFRNGYGFHVPSMCVEIKDICFGEGYQKWGAKEGVNYFVIKLGNIFDAKNLTTTKQE